MGKACLMDECLGRKSASMPAHRAKLSQHRLSGSLCLSTAKLTLSIKALLRSPDMAVAEPHCRRCSSFEHP